MYDHATDNNQRVVRQLQNVYLYQNEWAALDGIPTGQIREAWQIPVTYAEAPANADIFSSATAHAINPAYQQALSAGNVHIITNPQYTQLDRDLAQLISQEGIDTIAAASAECASLSGSSGSDSSGRVRRAVRAHAGPGDDVKTLKICLGAFNPDLSTPPTIQNNSPTQGKGSVARDDGKTFQLKAWGGDSNDYWQGQVCLWDNPHTSDHYAWTYQCSSNHALDNGYNDTLTLHAINTTNDEFQLTSHNTCLLSTPDTSSSFNPPGWGTNINWGTQCTTTNQNSIWHWINTDQIEDQYGQLLGFRNSAKLYWASPYGYMKVSTYHPTTTNNGKDWTQWKLQPQP